MFSKSAKMTVIVSSATILLILLNLITTLNGLPIESNEYANSASGHFESFEGFDEHPHDFGEELQSEHLGDYHETFGHEHEHEHEHDFGSNHLDLHSDFDEKAVPGIDHGKGAFSYSSTYEFKDADQQKHDFGHSF